MSWGTKKLTQFFASILLRCNFCFALQFFAIFASTDSVITLKKRCFYRTYPLHVPLEYPHLKPTPAHLDTYRLTTPPFLRRWKTKGETLENRNFFIERKGMEGVRSLLKPSSGFFHNNPLQQKKIRFPRVSPLWFFVALKKYQIFDRGFGVKKYIKNRLINVYLTIKALFAIKWRSWMKIFAYDADRHHKREKWRF